MQINKKYPSCLDSNRPMAWGGLEFHDLGTLLWHYFINRLICNNTDFCHFSHTGNGSIDLIIPGVHKANGLRQLQKLWGIDDSEVVVFGDGGNDIEMLRQAGFSFAMENAGSAVVAAAKYRAGSNNREGVLDVIDKVLKHEAPFDQ